MKRIGKGIINHCSTIPSHRHSGSGVNPNLESPELSISSSSSSLANFALASSSQHSKNNGPACTDRIGVVFTPPTSSPGTALVLDAGCKFGSDGIHAWGCYTTCQSTAETQRNHKSVEYKPQSAPSPPPSSPPPPYTYSPPAVPPSPPPHAPASSTPPSTAHPHPATSPSSPPPHPPPAQETTQSHASPSPPPPSPPSPSSSQNPPSPAPAPYSSPPATPETSSCRKPTAPAPPARARGHA